MGFVLAPRTGALLAMLTASFANDPAAQWIQLSPAANLGPREGAVAAHDPVRGQTILFGGDNTTPTTHAWDGTNWLTVASTGPSPRLGAGLVYHAAGGSLILFGGAASVWTPFNDTWRWDGTAWSQVASGGLQNRSRHGMAYDPLRARTVVFGGDAGFAPLYDTSEFDGTAWQQRALGGPTQRSYHGMAWDPGRRKILLFGGNFSSETWEWDGTTWTRLMVSAPPGRSGHAMVTTSRGIILFGGHNGLGTYFNDTWLWDGSGWFEMTGTTRPPARERTTLCAIPGGVLLYGGFAGGTPFADTWVMSLGPVILPGSAATVEGNTALALGDVPRRRQQTVVAAAAFAPAQRTGLLRGVRLRRDAGPTLFPGRSLDLRVLIGTAATAPRAMATNMLANWQGTPTLALQGTIALPDAGPVQPGPAPFGALLPFGQPFRWNAQDLTLEIEVAGASLLAPYDIDAEGLPYPAGAVSPFGTSCAGARGAPSLLPPDAHRLLPGGAIDIGVANALPAGLAFNFLGDSDTQWLGIPLPFQWPQTNCFVYLNWVLNRSTVVLGDGTARVAHPIPPDPGLAGRRLFSQWAVYEGAVAFPPLVLTSAVRLTIGTDTPVHWDTVSNADGSLTGVKASGQYVTPVVQFELN